MGNDLIITVVKAILCNAAVKAKLEEAAAGTDTPIDNVAVEILYMVLGCGE